MTKVRRNLVGAVLAVLVAGVLAYFATDLARVAQRSTEAPSHVPADWASVRESPGHKAHVGKGTIACHDCHAETDASFRLREGACTACHAAQAARTHAGDAAKPTPCATCHQFGDKPVPTCLSCHTNAQGKLAAVAVHVTAGSPCTTCHDPHKELPLAQADCGSCHKDVSATHGTMHVSGVAAKQHVAAVAPPVDASVDGLAPPTTWFGTTGPQGHAANGTCSDCHAPHARAVDARATCQGCHEKAPHGDKPAGHAACVTCHTPHDLTAAAVKPCAGCHADKRSAITPAHAECKTCHTPHAPQPENAKNACTTCHKNQVTLGAPKVEAHVACANCHKPHEPNASPGAACVTCHAKMAVKHAPGRSDKCTDCHAMHPGRGATFASSIPHAGSAAMAAPCTACHKDKAASDTSGHPPGLGCTGCHKPHDFPLAAAKGAFCAKCHASETKTALASKGHNDCVKCHSDIHKPTKGPPCGTCHAAEASTAPRGHLACQNCHEPHDGAKKPSATCQSCHALEAATKHAHVPGGCATCHRPHGPSGPAGPAGFAASAPACTTCHESAKLPGLHKVRGASPGGHAQCASCHSSHLQAIRADRATCTSCHEKQKNHQPSATECNGCHIFRGP